MTDQTGSSVRKPPSSSTTAVPDGRQFVQPGIPSQDRQDSASNILIAPVVPPVIEAKTAPDQISSPGADLNLNTAILRLQTSTESINVGDQFILTIQTDHAGELYSAPFYLQYDPQALEFIGLSEGQFLKKDGNLTAFIYSVNPDTGEIIIGLSRLGDVSGATGSGTLALATFRAKSPGNTSVTPQNVDFRDSRLNPINMVVESGAVQIR
jgi:general secretion pathway protein D